METTSNLPVLKLSDICRACLMHTKDMRYLFVQDLIAMLQAITSLEFECDEILPSYICKSCQEKLQAAYDFQQQVLKSCEVVKQCVLSHSMDNVSVTNLNEPLNKECPNIPTLETSNHGQVLASGIKESDNNFYSDLDCSNGDGDDASRSRQNKKKKLFKVAIEEVNEAIEKVNEHFYGNRKCGSCGFVASNSRSLTLHVSHLHSEMREKFCLRCNIEVDDLAAHQKSHSRDELKCCFCQRPFKMKSHLIEHLRGHSSTKPFRCFKCERSFVSNRHLILHQRIHGEKKAEKKKRLRVARRTCGDTDGSYGNEDDSERGKSVRSPGEVRLCPTCGKLLKSTSQWLAHSRKHSGRSPYKCRRCDASLSSRGALVSHERCHTGHRPHTCTVCNKSFAQSSTLATHMHLHTGGGPLECRICLRRFSRRGLLLQHQRRHTGERPFRCSQCERAFAQRGHLVEHSRIHSGEKPYRCGRCDMGFVQRSTLMSHMAIHTGEKPFKCPDCPYACRQSSSLTRHLKRQHALAGA